MKNSAFLSRLKPVLSDMHTRQHSVPALLVQRCGALLLDIGFIIGLIVLYHVAKHVVFDIPFDNVRPRYVPPHPDMGWTRTQRSLAVSGTIIAIMSAFIASPLRATPGMLAFHLQVTNKAGKTLHFVRAFAWVTLAFLPLLLANYLLLIAVAMEIPLLHFSVAGLFGINLFSLMVALQNIWFAAILLRLDKRAIPDILLQVNVVHKCHDETGVPKMQRRFYLPFLAFFAGLIGITGTIAAINIFDPPLSHEIKLLREQKPGAINSLRSTWKNQASFEVSLKIENFRCASKHKRFDVHDLCKNEPDIDEILAQNATFLEIYEQDLNVPDTKISRAHDKYLNQESVALTDLFLADLIHTIETKPDQADTVFKRWLLAEQFWSDAIRKPGFLVTQTRALIHYAHILQTLPILGASAPDMIRRHAAELQQRFTPVAFDHDFVRGLMAYEYDVYERVLGYSQIDYFPLVQPNHTRNQFLIAVRAYEAFLNDGVFQQSFDTRTGLLQSIRDQYNWTVIYNPLGVRFRDLALESLQSNLHIISAYHNNNALKKMLKLYVKAQENRIAPSSMADFLEAAPAGDKSIFKDTKFSWDPDKNALYYGLPHAPGLIHYLVF